MQYLEIVLVVLGPLYFWNILFGMRLSWMFSRLADGARDAKPKDGRLVACALVAAFCMARVIKNATLLLT